MLLKINIDKEYNMTKNNKKFPTTGTNAQIIEAQRMLQSNEPQTTGRTTPPTSPNSRNAFLDVPISPITSSHRSATPPRNWYPQPYSYPAPYLGRPQPHYQQQPYRPYPMPHFNQYPYPQHQWRRHQPHQHQPYAQQETRHNRNVARAYHPYHPPVAPQQNARTTIEAKYGDPSTITTLNAFAQKAPPKKRKTEEEKQKKKKWNHQEIIVAKRADGKPGYEKYNPKNPEHALGPEKKPISQAALSMRKSRANGKNEDYKKIIDPVKGDEVKLGTVKKRIRREQKKAAPQLPPQFQRGNYAATARQQQNDRAHTNFASL